MRCAMIFGDYAPARMRPAPPLAFGPIRAIFHAPARPANEIQMALACLAPRSQTIQIIGLKLHANGFVN